MLNEFTVIGCLILFATGSCKTRELKSSDLVEINIEQNVKNVKPLTICDYHGEISYVPLKDHSIPLKVAAISDFSQERILVSDRKSCLLCDYQGNLIASIGKSGKGPGEYFVITNMRFGPDNRIYLQNERFILVYDQAGNYLYQFKPEVNPEVSDRGGIMDSWAPFNDSLFIGQVSNDSGKEKYKAVFFNTTGKTIFRVPNHTFLNIERFYTSGSNSHADIYNLHGNLIFKEKLNDTVFKVTTNYRLEPVYYFTLGKYGMPKAIRESITLLREKKMDYIGIEYIMESLQYLFLSCNFGNHYPARRPEPIIDKEFGIISNYYRGRMLGIYDKSSKELLFAEPEKTDNLLTNCGLKNDFDGGINFYPREKVNDSTFAMWVDAYQLKEHVASEEFKNSTPKHPNKKRELQELVNRLTDSDNPVLILCTFKK